MPFRGGKDRRWANCPICSVKLAIHQIQVEEGSWSPCMGKACRWRTCARCVVIIHIDSGEVRPSGVFVYNA